MDRKFRVFAVAGGMHTVGHCGAPFGKLSPLSGLLIERCPSVRRAKVDARDKSGRSIQLDHRHC